MGKRMTDEEADRLSEQAQQVAASAFELTPEPDYWGLESYDSADGAYGIGGFLWFESKAELLDFAGRLLPFYETDPDPERRDDYVRDAPAVAERVRTGKLSMEAGRRELNEVLRNRSQIRWWGQFRALLSDDGDFERDVRGWFRGRDTDDGEPGDTGPIEAVEIESFTDALREYGL